MFFKPLSGLVTSLPYLSEHAAAGVAVVVPALFEIGLFRLRALKGVTDDARFQTARDLFKVAAKDPFERTARHKDLMPLLVPSQHRRHIRPADTGVA